MIKTFIFGTILGLLGSGAAAWYVPPVDLHRERSHVSVQPNGGNLEQFQINLPNDRIMVGLPNAENSIPVGLDWPGEDFLGNMQAEVFKVRDRNNTVVGVASRLASASEETGPFIEWALHLPARGTMYSRMQLLPTEDGVRNGTLISGTREFAVMTGAVREQFVNGPEGDPEVQGQIRLDTVTVGPLGDAE